MLSALNKSPISETMWLSRTDLLRMNRHIKTMVVHIKQYAVLANLIIKCIKLNTIPNYAMFGENLTLKNLDESDVFFGNQYRLGEAILEVSKIREPCWKIQTKYGIKDLVKRMSTSGKQASIFECYKKDM